MWPLLISASFAAVEVHDLGDFEYLLDAFRAPEAMPWLLAELAAHPDDVLLQLEYYRAVASNPALRGPLLPGVPAAAPNVPRAEEPALGAAIAYRLAVEALPDGMYVAGTPSQSPERWCPAAYEALAFSPEEPRDLDVVLWARGAFGRVCGWPEANEAVAARKPLALSGQLGAFAHARAAMRVEVTDEVVAEWRGVLADRWWLVLEGLGGRPDTLQGPGVESLKDLFRAHADALAASDSPSQVRAAIDVRRWLGVEEQGDLWRRLTVLDPQAILPRPAPDAQAAEYQLDPERRRVALREEGPGDHPWSRCQWWMARGETEVLAGEERAALAFYGHARRICDGYKADVAFGLAALAADRRLSLAVRAVSDAIDGAIVPVRSLVGPDGGARREAWLEGWTDALDLRADLHVARGRHDLAWDDRAQAAALLPTSALLVALGLAKEPRDPATARDALAAALAGPGLDADTATVVRQVLEERLMDEDRQKLGPLFSDDPAARAARVDAEIARMAPPPSAEAAPEVLGPFPEVSLRIGGEDRLLSSLSGPLVLDLWATWCGPCKQSLPHLDGLARLYAGRVTFLAVSVDDEAAVAERYLANQGQPAFTPAWGGRALWNQLDLHGIPRFYVLDADHAIVATSTGFGAGNRDLDDAVERMLAAE